jgi:uncharacterized protein YyaL (SSP411 family)
MRAARLTCLALLALGCRGADSRESAPPAARIDWIPWSDDVLARAKSEGKLVLLDLEAVWCHWCHVMDETSYRDPEVARLLGEHYLAVRVDQDSRPDLSNRYEDYGWPATIVFRGDGVELAKRSGYIPPGAMASMLRAFAEDPTPGPSALAQAAAASTGAAGASAIPEDLRAELERLHAAAFDRERAGWGSGNKWLDPPSVEYSIARSRDGDEESTGMARRTLDAALALVDPVWGGVYQYSAGGDWKEPHFEKIMSFQADDLRVYSLAAAAYGDARYLEAARVIEGFLRTFLLQPGGSFATSMDADLVPGEHAGEYFAQGDAERRRRGLPRIDAHAYARENGWAIRGLAAAYAWTGDERALGLARAAAEWVLAHRALPGGGFRHGEDDPAGPYLGDTLAMGQAFLALQEATGERAWLARSAEALGFATAHFAAGDSGFATAAVRAGSALGPAPNRGENAELARWANLLHRYTGREEHRAAALRAMRFLAAPEVARRPFASAVLLADRELSSEPLHVVVVGRKGDASALALFRAALAVPESYRRIEWLDRSEGPLPNGDVEFPELERPAAFVCAGERCSSPAYEPADVAARVRSLARRN